MEEARTELNKCTRTKVMSLIRTIFFFIMVPRMMEMLTMHNNEGTKITKKHNRSIDPFSNAMNGDGTFLSKSLSHWGVK